MIYTAYYIPYYILYYNVLPVPFHSVGLWPSCAATQRRWATGSLWKKWPPRFSVCPRGGGEGCFLVVRWGWLIALS